MRFFPYLFLLLETLLFYRQVLFSDGAVIPWDFRYFHFPIARFFVDAIQRGEFPLWDSYTYCGRPLYANLQSQFFYPPAMATALLSAWTGAERLLYFMHWQSALHVWLGGIFAFRLARALGTSKTAALCAATIFQLGAYFTSQAQHMGAVNAMAWLPAAWLCALRVGPGDARRPTAALAATCAMAWLSGPPMAALVILGSTFLLGLALRWRQLHWIAAGIGGSLLLAAVQLVPGYELSRLSVGQFRPDWMRSGPGLPLQSLITLIAPNYHGVFDLQQYKGAWDPTFLYLYCSLTGLALALRGLTRQPRLAALWIASTVWMLGDATPVWALVTPLIPGAVQGAIYPYYALAVFVLTVGLLAAAGLDRLPARPWLGYAAVALIAIELTLVGSDRPFNTSRTAAEPGLQPGSFDGSSSVLEQMRRLSQQAVPPYRIDTIDDSINWAMGATLTRVPTANGYDPLVTARLIQARLAFCKGERWGAYYQVSRPDSPMLDFMNVRYLLSRSPQPGLHKVMDLPGRAVYENPGVMPRFFLAPRVRYTKGPAGEDFDPHLEAVVEGAGSSGARAPGTIKLMRYDWTRVELEVESRGPSFLASSEAHYPGWRAYVDGAERPIVYTNIAFRGLELPAGLHRVQMRFQPRSLWWGLAVSLLAWLAACAACAACLAPRRAEIQ